MNDLGLDAPQNAAAPPAAKKRRRNLVRIQYPDYFTLSLKLPSGGTWDVKVPSDSLQDAPSMEATLGIFERLFELMRADLETGSIKGDGEEIAPASSSRPPEDRKLSGMNNVYWRYERSTWFAQRLAPQKGVMSRRRVQRKSCRVQRAKGDPLADDDGAEAEALRRAKDLVVDLTHWD